MQLTNSTGVSLVKLNGRNNFAVKKLLSSADLTGNYLVHDPLFYHKDHKDDWLLESSCTQSSLTTKTERQNYEK